MGRQLCIDRASSKEPASICQRRNRNRHQWLQHPRQAPYQPQGGRFGGDMLSFQGPAGLFLPAAQRTL
eukprot:8864948-Alexandrium_andersonii.AAC.1